MKKITTIIWDLDGTLLNTLEDLTDSVNHMLSIHNYPLRTIGEIRSFVGNGLAKLTERSLPDSVTTEEYETCLSEFKAYYKLHMQDKTGPYDGVLDVLKALHDKGYHMAVVSNKADAAVKELIPIYFGDLLPIAIGDMEGREKKPAPDSVYEAMRQLGVTKEECIYIGDSDVDVNTARNSGIPGIAVLWGFRTKEQLEAVGATTFAEKPEELITLLEQM